MLLQSTAPHINASTTERFQLEMARIKTIVENTKPIKSEPMHRPRSAPLYQRNETETVVRARLKRAQSEACIDDVHRLEKRSRTEEWVSTRVSKRLRGLAPSPSTSPARRRANVGGLPVEPGRAGPCAEVEMSRAGDGLGKQRKLERYPSSDSRTTCPETDPASNPGIVSDQQSASPVCVITQPEEDTINSQTHPSDVSLTGPSFRNGIPPQVLIDGEPSFRFVFRGICHWRRRAMTPLHEWSGCHFLGHVISQEHQLKWQTDLLETGYILLPDDLFGALPVGEEPSLLGLMNEFFDKYALRGQSLPTLSTFVNPQTRLVEPERLLWWKTLADFWHLPDLMGNIFHVQAGTWHEIFHALPTIASLSELSEVIELLGLKRAQEVVHLELARRVTTMKERGHGRFKVHFQLLQMGYEELRKVAREFGDRIVESCSMCCIQPPLKGGLGTPNMG